MISICHQLPQRSFLWLWDPPVLCARCTGFYLALLVALALAALRPARMNARTRHAFGAGCIACLAMAAEKGLGLEIGNWGRFATALPFGFAVGVGLAMPFIFQPCKEEFQ